MTEGTAKQNDTFLTILIAEDDPNMRRVLKKIAEENSNVLVVGEAANGAEALSLFDTLYPRVVFIDVDLPVMDGVTLAREIFDRNPWTYLVFITAYSQYRRDAFEVYAFDYLVKPFKSERLRQTLERLRMLCTGRPAGRSVPIASRLSCFPGQNMRIFRAGAKMAVLPLKDIVFITREGRRTVIYHTGGRLETTETLETLGKELGYPFLRTHKGFIVNLAMVREIIPSGRSTYELVMAHTDKRPLITWNKLRELESILGWGRTCR